jgi:hypothetical protein
MNSLPMQLSLEILLADEPQGYRRSSPHRANWWFNRMRQAVDLAIDWPHGPPRSEVLPAPAGVGEDRHPGR